MNRLYAVLYPILWLFMKITHPWRAVGRENLPEGGALLCGNHTTLGDPVYVVCAVGHRPQIRVMAKDEVMHTPALGFILRHAGIIGVKRGKADVGAVKACLKALKSGEKLLLFPEGTRVKEGETSEAHTGAAMFRRTTVVFGQPYHPAFEGRKATPEDYQRIADELMDKIRALGEGVS